MAKVQILEDETEPGIHVHGDVTGMTQELYITTPDFLVKLAVTPGWAVGVADEVTKQFSEWLKEELDRVAL